MTNHTQANVDPGLDIRKSYMWLRILIGVVGVTLPLLLATVATAKGINWHELASMSAAYWIAPPLPGSQYDFPLRPIFVGCLWAIGIGLIAYRGHTLLENVLLNVSGSSAISVAMFPMGWEKNFAGQSDPAWPAMHFPAVTLMGIAVHYIAASTFFLMMFLTIAFCSRTTLNRTSDRKPKLADTTRRAFELIYGFFGLMMVWAAIAYFQMGVGQRLFYAEWIGSGAFSGYWFVKTLEISWVSRAEDPEVRLQDSRSSGLFSRLRFGRRSSQLPD